MKLYLKSQCKDRALLVFENEEKLEEKKEVKILNLHKTRQKTYEKKIQGLILYKIVNFSSVVRMNPYGLSSKQNFVKKPVQKQRRSSNHMNMNMEKKTMIRKKMSTSKYAKRVPTVSSMKNYENLIN